jgi:cellulose synthase/poly-beta-1,6-N-acetylglucosamine synthase-like glycosyltransferase
MILLHPFEANDPWHLPLVALFLAAATGIWLFGISRWKNLLTSIRAIYFNCGNKNTKSTCETYTFVEGQEPFVTIQICTYNEATVIKETIVRVCSLDWPIDRLQVQICDDSTEKESIAVIENEVLHWREQGYNISRLERPDRVGYKAGNLQYNFRFIEGEYVVYLDADHQLEKDFLRSTIPHFYDNEGNPKSNVGLVQAPWAYYNTHQNLLTECGKLFLSELRFSLNLPTSKLHSDGCDDLLKTLWD